MKYGEIIEQCIEIRRTWNQVTHTLDGHADEFLKKITNDNEKVFIKQVFYGLYRYEEFINTFNNAIFKVNPASTNRNDGNLYGIFLYLIVFRFDELPFDEFKKLVLSQNPVKMHVMFQFLFDVNMLKSHVRDDWCKIYDASYIDEFVIGGLQEKLTKMADLLATVSKKATGKVSELVSSLGTHHSEKETKSNGFKPTQPQPFKLTQPKVKAIPAPIMIPKIVKSNPIPETTYKGSVKELEEQKKKKKEEIKKMTEEKYKAVKKFELETEKRPTKLEELKKEAEAQLQEEISTKFYFRPPPVFEHSENEIKLNAATILKEEAIIKQMKKKEEDYLKQIEMNLRDSAEFERWKKEQEEKEKIAQLEEQERKRIEMQLAREAAMKAVEEKYRENKKNVEKMKELSKEYQKELENKLKAEFEHKKELKQTVLETRGNYELEKKKILEENKQKHDELNKEKKKLLEMKKAEDEIEMMKKKELIAKIRELEKIPVPRTKAFDPTETGGHGLLEEMTLIELRERLEMRKKEIAEYTEKKRVEIIKEKETKLTSLQQKAAQIKALRAESAEIHQQKRIEKKLKEEEERKRKQEIREKSLLEVSQKIKTKKLTKQQELERIANELREINLKRQFLNANAAMVEEKAWKSLEDGAEREIKFRQNEKLLEQEKIETIKLKERTILAKRATDMIEKKLEEIREYDERVEKAKQENEVLWREEREEKRRKFEEIKRYEQSHLDNMVSRDPFKSKIATMSLTNAKSKQASRSSNSNITPMKQEIILPPSKYAESIH